MVLLFGITRPEDIEKVPILNPDISVGALIIAKRNKCSK